MAKKDENNIEQATNKDGSAKPKRRKKAASTNHETVHAERNPSYMQDTIVSLTKVSQALAEPGPLQASQLVHEYGKKTIQNEETYTVMEICSETLDIDKVVLGRFATCVMDCLYSMNTSGIKKFSIEQLANYLLKREVKFESLETNFQSALDYMKVDSNGFPEIPEDQLDFYNQLHLLMHKLAKTFIRLDCTNLRYTTGEKVPDLLVMYGPLVPLTIYEGESPVTKRKRIMYRMSEKPIVYEYAEALRRLTRIPGQALSTNLPANPDSVVLSNILGKEIKQLKNKNNSKKTSCIDLTGPNGLYQELGVTKEQFPDKSRLSRERKKLRLKVEKVLDGFVSSGFITRYVEHVEGNCTTQYDIVL